MADDKFYEHLDEDRQASKDYTGEEKDGQFEPDEEEELEDEGDLDYEDEDED